MAPILHRLQSLSITGSYNAQIPYLLRDVLPDGLPHLKSLEIQQLPWSDTNQRMRREKGSMWYEQPDGTFCVAKNGKQAKNTIMGNYLFSIVKGAPNVEELGLHGGGCLRPENVVSTRGIPQLNSLLISRNFRGLSLLSCNISLRWREYIPMGVVSNIEVQTHQILPKSRKVFLAFSRPFKRWPMFAGSSPPLRASYTETFLISRQE